MPGGWSLWKLHAPRANGSSRKQQHELPPDLTALLFPVRMKPSPATIEGLWMCHPSRLMAKPLRGMCPSWAALLVQVPGSAEGAEPLT